MAEIVYKYKYSRIQTRKRILEISDIFIVTNNRPVKMSLNCLFNELHGQLIR